MKSFNLMIFRNINKKKYLYINQMYFYKTKVKSAEKIKKNNEKTEDVQIDPLYKVKPNANDNVNNPNLKLLNKLNDTQLKAYYTDLRDASLNLKNSGIKYMLFGYILHLSPFFLFAKYTSNFIWVYQIFWIGTSVGLVHSAYEFYSDKNEKKILDNHLLFA